MVEELLVVVLSFLQEGGCPPHEVQLHDEVVELFYLAVFLLGVFHAREELFCGADLLLDLHLEGETSGIFKNFMGDTELRRDVAVVFQLNGLALAGEVVELSPLHSLSDTLLCDFFEDGEKVAHRCLPCSRSVATKE